MHSITTRLLTVLLSLFCLGCSTPQLVLSKDLHPVASGYPVKGRTGLLIRQKISFGDFATTYVRRSWTKGSSARTGLGMGDPGRMEWINLISTEYIRRKQTLNFGFTDGSLRTEAFCVSRFNADDLQVGRNKNSLPNILLDLGGRGIRFENLFYVQIYSGDDPQPWQLVLDNHAAQASVSRYEGMLAKSRDEWYALVPATGIAVNGRAGTLPFGSAGFEIRNSRGKAVAAVSLMDKGMVYLADLPAAETLLVATLCTALLLQQQIG